MKNYIQKGDVIVVEAPSGGITSGQIVNVGVMSGVAASSGDEGDSVAVNLEGVFEVEKTAALAVTAGEEVYVNTTTKKVTKTITDKPLGVAFADAAGDDTTVIVKLVPKKGDTNSTITQAANVAALGTTTNLTAVPVSFADEAAVQTYLVTLRSETEARLDAIEAKVDAEIAALKAAGLQASS
jgi:predicted RecA/RadA family phage recombinase